MSELLSQEEVNALLQSVPQMEETPSAPTLAPTKPGRYRKKADRYDFKRPNRISKNILQSLHFLHERYSRNLALNLSAYLRTLTDIVLLSVDQLSYAEFLMSLPETTCINTVRIEPQGGTLAFEVNPTLVFSIIEKLMGGSSETPTVNREITLIEQNLVEGFVQMALDDLQEAWNAIGRTRFVLERQETSPQLVQIVAPNEIVVVVVFEVKIGQSSGMMNFCIPAVYLEPFSTELRRESRTAVSNPMGPEDYRRIDEVLANAEARMQVNLGEGKMPIRDLLRLRIGDVVPLGRDTQAPVTVRVAGIPKFRAVFGARKGKRAAKILAPILPEEEPLDDEPDGFEAAAGEPAQTP
ncbi:MAG: flagellar motor switch protein FliM [Deferrisomatales bacterium]